MQIETYTGLLAVHSYAGEEDVLFLSSLSCPLVDELQWMCGKCVRVRYWITDQRVSKEEAQSAFSRRLVGQVEGVFGAKYSEITGYLWTDEELTVGGHDLVAELYTHEAKWLILEVEECTPVGEQRIEDRGESVDGR